MFEECIEFLMHWKVFFSLFLEAIVDRCGPVHVTRLLVSVEKVHRKRGLNLINNFRGVCLVYNIWRLRLFNFSRQAD